MPRARWIVAAALAGGVATTLTVATLALGAGGREDALVTLQVAPRGPGSVSAMSLPSGPTELCTGNDQTNDCTFSYERGTSVRLTESSAGTGTSFFAWSDQDCGTSATCTVKLDDDLTSVVALFSPLTLRVVFAGDEGAATVTANPPGQSCPRDSDELFCGRYPPHTQVALTLNNAPTFNGWNEGGDYLCEPVRATTCTIAVEDEPTWAGVRFGDVDPPNLATTISVDFKLRKSGNGSGRVTASKLDCGTVCTSSYGYGKPITLTAAPDDGSLFDGWNGVCGKTQLTCRFAAGPITSIRVTFTRDSTPPSAPGSPSVGSRTRTSLELSWGAATDNVRVTGYRVYVDDAEAGETQGTTYTLQGLKCGRRYAVAVDAVDALGNRSQRAAATVETQPCALAARLAGVRVTRSGRARIVVATVRVNRATTARLRLLAGRRGIASARFAVRPGTNALRLRVPARVPRGSYRLATTLANPDGGTLTLRGRGVLLPRP
jgi:hypothetical protein